MPTYDYVCRACDAELEVFQSITESARRKCPECGALKLTRKIGTGAGILFKGSGFYETDYRSASYKQGAEADKPKSDSKSDSKSKKDTGSKKKPD
jgi:putative FmdB family regulatory protein